MEERGDKESMVVALNGPDLACVIGSSHVHPICASDVLHVRSQAIRAGCALGRLIPAINRGEAGTPDKFQRDGLVLKITCQLRDNWLTAGTVLSMGSIWDSRQVPGVLYEHVLKAASRTHQWDSALASRPYHSVSPFRVCIGAAWPHEHR